MSQVRFAFDGESLITPEMIAANIAPSTDAQRQDRSRTAQIQLALLLQITQQRLASSNASDTAVGYLFQELHKMRHALDPDIWLDLVPMAQSHPVAALIHEDPFTRRSFEKPRGYSGDAGLLDFIYRHPNAEAALAETSPLGKAIYDYTSAAPAAAAVRERRDLLAAHVDAIAEARGADTEILTIAAGHLREADLSTAFRDRAIKRWVALDQDPESVASITRDFAGTAVEAVEGSVRGLLAEAYDLGSFDFVYAAGLYDYLPESVAVKLTRQCMTMLKPGGTFLFANFHSDIVDDAFMETFMNWSLILRSEDEVRDIVNASVDRNGVDASVFSGDNGNIVYGVIRKL